MNRVLPLDPDYQTKLKDLRGRVVGIFFTDLDLPLYFLANENQFTVLCEYQGKPDVKLSGKSWDFFHLGMDNRGTDTSVSFDNSIHFEGDVATGQKFAQLFAELNIDWEEALADITGDIFAHQAVNVARHAGSWLKEVLTSSQDNLSEYFQEEIRITPSKIETENFIDDINIIKDDAEQLITKFEQLFKNLESKDLKH